MDPVSLALAKQYTDERIATLPLESLMVAIADLRSVIAWDTFRRPNGPIGVSDSGHTWQNIVGTWTISDRRVAGSGDGGICVVDIGTSHQSIEVTGAPGATPRDFGVVGLFVDASNYVRLRMQRDRVTLEVILEGSVTELFRRDYASANEWSNSLRSLRLDLMPNNLRSRIKARCFLDDEFLAEATIGETGYNALAAATKCGMWNNYSAAQIYRFVARSKALSALRG